MDLNEYQAAAIETAIYPGKGSPLGLMYCGLKLAGEAGEVAEKLGKAIRDDAMFQIQKDYPSDEDGPRELVLSVMGGGFGITPERRESLKGELGDVLWYVAAAARELGYDLADIAQANLDKLADRAARGVLQGSGDNR